MATERFNNFAQVIKKSQKAFFRKSVSYTTDNMVINEVPQMVPSHSQTQSIKRKLTSSSSSSPAAAFSALCRFLLGASSSSLSSAI
jgi:hypothetical protein